MCAAWLDEQLAGTLLLLLKHTYVHRPATVNRPHRQTQNAAQCSRRCGWNEREGERCCRGRRSPRVKVVGGLKATNTLLSSSMPSSSSSQSDLQLKNCTQAGPSGKHSYTSPQKHTRTHTRVHKHHRCMKRHTTLPNLDDSQRCLSLQRERGRQAEQGGRCAAGTRNCFRQKKASVVACAKRTKQHQRANQCCTSLQHQAPAVQLLALLLLPSRHARSLLLLLLLSASPMPAALLPPLFAAAATLWQRLLHDSSNSTTHTQTETNRASEGQHTMSTNHTHPLSHATSRVCLHPCRACYSPHATSCVCVSHTHTHPPPAPLSHQPTCTLPSLLRCR